MEKVGGLALCKQIVGGRTLHLSFQVLSEAALQVLVQDTAIAALLNTSLKGRMMPRD